MNGRFLIAAALALVVSQSRAHGAPVADEDITVFAAASLRDVFERLVPAFERAQPRVKVHLNLAGSQELRAQIEQGARADVFASADLKHMGLLDKQGLVDPPAVFARNEPVIVVPRGNPAGIRAITDLPKAKRLVVGAPEVPIGGYTVKIFDALAAKHGADLRAKIDANVVSRELNVKQVLAKVTLGEADAGVVYRTDARAAKDKVDIVAIPADLNVVAEYPIAVVKATSAAAAARAWVSLVLSADGQRELAAAGFSAAGAAKAPQAPAPDAVHAR